MLDAKGNISARFRCLGGGDSEPAVMTRLLADGVYKAGKGYESGFRECSHKQCNRG